jgi:hypothetical protein
VFVGRVVFSKWDAVAYVRVFCVGNTVVALVSCVEQIAHVNGVTAVWVTIDILVSDVCVAATLCVSNVCAAATMRASGVCVSAIKGFIAFCVSA